MANNPNVNKVVYGNQTIMDLTNDDVTPVDVAEGKTFHDRSGAQQTGTGNYYSPNDTAETDIADDDYFPFFDVSAESGSGAKRKSLWSNIKSVLKTYFDTVYLKLTDKDEYTDFVTQDNTTVTFSNLDPSYGYVLEYHSPDTETGDLTIPKWSNINKTISNNRMTLVYTVSGGTSGTSQYRLRIKK